MKYCMFSLMQNLDLRYMCACTHVTRQQKKGRTEEDNGGTNSTRYNDLHAKNCRTKGQEDGSVGKMLAVPA